MISTKIRGLTLRQATTRDVSLVLSFIRELAGYERLTHEVTATEAHLRETLFGPCPRAEVIFGVYEGREIAYALFFHNYSSFQGRPGLYLEDIYVKPEMRGQGCARAMLAYLARLAVERGCGRFDWTVLDWNEPALRFYRSLGAVPMSEWTIQRLTGADLKRLASES